MRRFGYYFVLFICGTSSMCNVVMVYQSFTLEHPLKWLAVVFFGSFSLWWGWQLYRFYKDFGYLKEQ